MLEGTEKLPKRENQGLKQEDHARETSDRHSERHDVDRAAATK